MKTLLVVAVLLVSVSVGGYKLFSYLDRLPVERKERAERKAETERQKAIEDERNRLLAIEWEKKNAEKELDDYFLLWKGYTSFRFRVLDVTDKGCRITFHDVEDDDNDIFVYALSGYSGRLYRGEMPDGNLLVKSAGSLTYTTVAGSVRRIPAYLVASDEIRENWIKRKKQNDEPITYLQEVSKALLTNSVSR
jgi:hypothetical protein